MKIYAVLIVAVLLMGCTGGRSLTKHKPKKLDSTSILSFLKDNSGERSLKVRGKVDVETSYVRYSATTVMQIIPDSLFWMNATKLGFEVFRLLVTRDSISYIDRFNRMYFHSSIDEVANYYQVPIQFEMLESLFFGNILGIKEKTHLAVKTMDKEKIQLGSQGYIIEDYWYLIENFTLEALNFQNGSGQAINAAFTDWQDLPDKKSIFPFSRTYQIPFEGDLYKADLEISRVEEVEDGGFHFSIPHRYERISF